MTNPITELNLPEERKHAKSMFGATIIPVNEHKSGTVTTAPAIALTKPDDAQFLQLQALTQNIRYRVDGITPTTSTGFQLAAGMITPIPVSVNQIIIIAETGTANYEAQWYR